MAKNLSTDPYKGTRDFYPEDMAVQRYIFDTWAKTAESFGYERYDASILEPSELYKSKGAENEELVNEQTYTFIDRGEREVTLRPEMTPTVARMVAGKRRELNFPIRWYSIPNLFRYERPQRGRLREHWQLNCDMFGVDHYSADVEMIALAYNVLKAFGAHDSNFEIRINDRVWLRDQLATYNLDESQMKAILGLIDRKDKINNFGEEAKKIVGKEFILQEAPSDKNVRLMHLIDGLRNLGIHNVVISPSTVRGFSYYTGTIFEIFDTDPKNNRSLIGGGRYDNLTSLFLPAGQAGGGETISGIGFGMGDVTMKDFLLTHKLLPKDIHVTAPVLVVVPMDEAQNIEAEKIAQSFRTANVRTSVDLSTKKVGKKISGASEAGVQYILVVGEEEMKSQTFIFKELATKNETSGTISELIKLLQG